MLCKYAIPLAISWIILRRSTESRDGRLLMYVTRVPFLRYGLTKNHGGSLDAEDAPRSSRTFGCCIVFQIETFIKESGDDQYTITHK